MSKRCHNCKKKTGTVPFECKCDFVFCGKCRQPFKHNCTFDYKKESDKKLKKSLVKVAGDKLNDRI